MTTCLHARMHCRIRMPTYMRNERRYSLHKRTRMRVCARAYTHNHISLSLSSLYAHTRLPALPDRTVASRLPASPPTVCAASKNAEQWLSWRHQRVSSTVHRRGGP